MFRAVEIAELFDVRPETVLSARRQGTAAARVMEARPIVLEFVAAHDDAQTRIAVDHVSGAMLDHDGSDS